MNFSLLYYDIVCYVIALCVFIVVFVFVLLFWNVRGKGSVNFGSDNQTVELLWTVIPTFIVLILCSLNVNFITAGLNNLSQETVKVIGHQWYWTYEVSGSTFDSFLCKDGFQVDKPLPLRYGVVYRLLVTSEDVIHSFSVPSLQIKMDAIPGRINSVFFVPDRYGSFVGYCSELCGVGHGYMPIVIEVIK
uniref:Cytochrome c oxidase subunit 2 n=1 Tax=Schistocephalus solidus TaxID=70667 RepID=A0A1E1GI55_SCHSO|nr:cytochrome c oxidase subunit 2 [Schistocephalus solidus]QXU59642.1 cytochrome c oxidase subunit 2 [Schistocephalus solidus]BAV82559.1 cytochrome c oxidase subunit II [Schistocephalus solidus]